MRVRVHAAEYATAHLKQARCSSQKNLNQAAAGSSRRFESPLPLYFSPPSYVFFSQQEEDATVIFNQDDQEASTLVLAETFTAPVMDGGGSRDSEEICNKNGRASAASPPLGDKKSTAEKEQGVSDQDQTLSTPSGCVSHRERQSPRHSHVYMFS